MSLPTEETREEFMERYGAGATPLGLFEQWKIALPCDCEDGGGPTHWAAVYRDPMTVRIHLELYAPEGTAWPEEIPRVEEAGQ